MDKIKPYLNNRSKKNYDETIYLIDLFSGIGGFHLGLEAAAEVFHKSLKCLISSEIDEACKETYFANFGVLSSGSVYDINLEDPKLKSADIITAGFPCQPFSNSGKKLGFNDPRGNFYSIIERFILKSEPKAFILENVPGIIGNGGDKKMSKLKYGSQISIGKTMQYYESKLNELEKYHVSWDIINSSSMGSPQVRKRVYIVGIHKEYSNKPLDFTFEKLTPNTFMDIAENTNIEGYKLNKNQEKNIRSFMNNAPRFNHGMRRVGQAYLCKGGNVGQAYHADGLLPTLTKVWTRFMPVYFPALGECRPRSLGDPFSIDNTYGNGTLRKITPREACRLQGFPDDFVLHPLEPRAYEQAGNAVNALVVKEIGRKIFSIIYK